METPMKSKDNKPTPIIRQQDTKNRVELLAKRLVMSSQPKQDKSVTDNIALNVLRGHLDNSKTSIVAAKVILESNPALERSLDILAGLIANPDGADGTNFVISSVVPEMGGLKVTPGDISAVIDFIEDYVNNTIKMRGSLEGIVKEILGVRGAHIELYIPDAVTERMFNALGNESLAPQEFTRQFKPNEGSKTETPLSSKGIDFTADWNTYLPKLIHREKYTKVGNEADVKRKVSLSKVLKTRRVIKETPVVNIGVTDILNSRLSTLAIEVAAEACHPMCANGDPTNPLGYLFLLDENNGFVRIDDNIDFDETLRDKSNTDSGIAVMSSIASAFKMTGVNKNGANSTYAQARALYEEFSREVTDKQIAALMKDNYVDNYSLADDQQLSEIMFWRLLKEQKTRVLFVPDSLVSYIAFYRNASGVGQSILNRAKLLSRLYTVLYYADYMSYLESSVPHTEVTVTMDEADTDQAKRVEMVQAELAMSKSNLLRVSPGDPAGAINALSRHSTSVKVVGNGPDSNVPNMDITKERVKKDISPVASEFTANIRRDLTQKLNIPMEWVDQSYTVNFKAEVVRDNELVRKQLSWYTNLLNEGVTDRVVKRILNDPILTSACLDRIKGDSTADGLNKRKAVLEAIMINLKVELPAIKVNGVDLNKDQLDVARGIVEAVVLDSLPDSLVEQAEGLDAFRLEALRAAAVAHLMRVYTKKSTMFGEMADMLSDPAKMLEIAEVESDRLVSIIKAAEKFALPVIKQTMETTTKIEEAKTPPEEEVAEDTTTDTGGEEATTDAPAADDVATPPADGETGEPPTEDAPAEDTEAIPEDEGAIPDLPEGI